MISDDEIPLPMATSPKPKEIDILKPFTESIEDMGNSSKEHEYQNLIESLHEQIESVNPFHVRKSNPYL